MKKNKKNLFYDESIKIINDSYKRLDKINSLPDITVSKIKINNKYVFYSYNNDYNNNEDEKNKTHIIQKEEFNKLKIKVKEREKLIKINKKEEDKLHKNIKILNIIDKKLANKIKNKLFTYNLDAIPLKERKKFMAIIVPSLTNIYGNIIDTNTFFYNIDNNQFKKKFDDWINGKIKMKEIDDFIKKKFSN